MVTNSINKGWLNIANNNTKCGNTKPLHKYKLFDVFDFSQ